MRGWPWEVWNEPDGHYWKGTVEEFCAMYAVTAKAMSHGLTEGKLSAAFDMASSADFDRRLDRHAGP